MADVHDGRSKERYREDARWGHWLYSGGPSCRCGCQSLRSRDRIVRHSVPPVPAAPAAQAAQHLGGDPHEQREE